MPDQSSRSAQDGGYGGGCAEEQRELFLLHLQLGDLDGGHQALQGQDRGADGGHADAALDGQQGIRTGGLILGKEEFAKKLNSAVFPGTQGGPLEHVIAAKAVCLKEAMQPEFKTYAQNVVTNAKAMAEGLLSEGFDLITGGTDNHLMLADLRPMNITGKDLQAKCDLNHITLNKNAIPGDPQKPSITSGVRIGTAAATTRGLGVEEMKRIAHCVALTARDFDGTRKEVLDTVADICEKFPLYK